MRLRRITLSYCYWDNNKCIDIQDCSIESPIDCPYDTNCAYLEGKCTKFTSCDNYVGDKSSCEAISILCTSLDGKKCQNKVIPSCSDYNEEDCNYQEGKEGECGFIGDKCQVIKQCSDIDQIKGEFEFMKCILNIHSCKVSSSKCVQKKCSDLTDSSSCQYIHAFDPFDHPQSVQLCKWEDSRCVEAMPNDLNEATCFIDTQYSYLWNPNSKTCQKCNGPPSPPNPDNFGVIIRVAIMIFVISQ
ncbi:unnamed protein product (macronuclear) [Paramecium tetraurelia]|uniref:Uncharacterized protein n=1 Tax=Paramecium tetraurelia TaxID=5888 RepID=A0DU94_PARTE|nr:uncharacterized protein GSPATT00020283001 [Paramecium tetraurelia]CAK86611.1 unnamed protein product [Paramecium tetraurelia]|eukprot:XP_001454008.1 hypothetical protein (macronuclear) [Paramecium tetraurelia strain d4-2]